MFTSILSSIIIWSAVLIIALRVVTNSGIQFSNNKYISELTCYKGTSSNYKTTKKPVRMEYLDDIDIAEFREIPTFKRVCICILKNDHACKYMGFALNKSERERKEKILEKYKDIL